MSDFNSRNNRAVWFDIPVADLERAAKFYAAVLGVQVHRESFNEIQFAVLDHADGNGGCLVIAPDEIAAKQGILVYMNVDGRIRDAADKVASAGGEVLETVHAIGPHGFRAIVLDCEGNRIALHSNSDA